MDPCCWSTVVTSVWELKVSCRHSRQTRRQPSCDATEYSRGNDHCSNAAQIVSPQLPLAKLNVTERDLESAGASAVIVAGLRLQAEGSRHLMFLRLISDNRM